MYAPLRLAPLPCWLAGCQAGAPGAPAEVETTTVRCGEATVLAELAADPDSRGRGLMFRREVPAGTGMLFVLPARALVSFWMRDTFVPLSIAWLEDDGRIVQISDMAPFDETLHPSPVPVKAALEVPLDWFAEQGIRAGDTCDLGLPTDLAVR